MFKIVVLVISLLSLAISGLAYYKVNSGYNLDDKFTAYVENNPKKIVDSVNKFFEHERKKTDEDRIKDASSYIEKNHTNMLKGSPFIGSKDAEAKVVIMFSDYECGYCRAAHQSVKKILAEMPNVRFVIKEFPILGHTSELAAKAALAVFKINESKYAEFHEKLFASKELNQAEIFSIAASLGIKKKDLEEQMKKAEISSEISKNRESAVSLGVTGTPAFIIGQDFVPGFIEQDAMTKKIQAIK